MIKDKSAKLSKPEIAGIRLVADVFVVKELIDHLKVNYPAMDGLPEHLREHVPKFASTEQELAKQISLTRKQWMKLIKEEW